MQRIRSGVVATLLLAAAVLGAPPASAQAQTQWLEVPATTVVHVTMDEPLASDTARPGQRITATVSPDDLSGFPIGTRFEGVVTRVEPATAEFPGVISARWYSAITPNPQYIPIDGRLSRLDRGAVYRTRDGRRVTRRELNNRWRDRYDDDRGWRDRYRDRRRDRDDDDDDGISVFGTEIDPVWLGAGGGALLGGITGGSFLEGGLLGGLGGLIYGGIANQGIGGGLFTDADPTRPRVVLAAFAEGDAMQPFPRSADGRYPQVRLKRGEPFGIMLWTPARYQHKESYRFASPQRVMSNDRVLGARQEFADPTTVRVNGRLIEFKQARPMMVNEVLYVPLQPVIQGTSLRMHADDTSAATDRFQLDTPSGIVHYQLGAPYAMVGNRQYLVGSSPPMKLNGHVYVPVSFLAAVGMGGSYQPAQARLDLQMGSQ